MGLVPGLADGHGFPGSKVPTWTDPWKDHARTPIFPDGRPAEELAGAHAAGESR